MLGYCSCVPLYSLCYSDSRNLLSKHGAAARNLENDRPEREIKESGTTSINDPVRGACLFRRYDIDMREIGIGGYGKAAGWRTILGP